MSFKYLYAILIAVCTYQLQAKHNFDFAIMAMFCIVLIELENIKNAIDTGHKSESTCRCQNKENGDVV